MPYEATGRVEVGLEPQLPFFQAEPCDSNALSNV